jgi:hypothetical protein
MKRTALRHAIGVTLVLCLLVESAPLATAQGAGEKVAAPVTVRVNAAQGEAVVLQGAAASIGGESVPLGDKQQVRIEVTPPSGKTATLTAAILGDGRYSASFTATTEAGTYSVVAFSPDSATQAKARFRVVAPAAVGEVAERAVSALEGLGQEMVAAVDAIDQALAGRDDVPAQARESLAKARKDLEGLPRVLTDVRAELMMIAHVAQEYPEGAPKLGPIVVSITAVAEKAEETRKTLAQKTAAVPKSSGVCDRLDAAAEALAFMSLALDFVGKAFAVTVQLLTDKVLPDEIYNLARPPEKRSTAEKFVLSEVFKGAGAALADADGDAKAGLKKFCKSPLGLAADVLQTLTAVVYDAYCERFQGPLDATLQADFMAGGKPFWGYTVTLGGRLVLRFEKKHLAGGGPIPLTGEFEGNGDFKMYEDLMAFNPFMRRFVLFKKLHTPVGGGAVVRKVGAWAGKIARAAATPAYFLVPVKGTLVGNEITLQVGEANVDFSDGIGGTAYYVLMPPSGLPLPSVQKWELPIQKAQFVLSRGLRKDAKVPVTLATRRGETFRIAQKTFTRTEADAASEYRLQWTVNVNACTPDCP